MAYPKERTASLSKNPTSAILCLRVRSLKRYGEVPAALPKKLWSRTDISHPKNTIFRYSRSSLMTTLISDKQRLSQENTVMNSDIHRQPTISALTVSVGWNQSRELLVLWRSFLTYSLRMRRMLFRMLFRH